MLPLAIDIRWRADKPPYATLGLIALMALMHFGSWIAIDIYGWPDNWRWTTWALVRNEPLPTQFVTGPLAHADFGHWFYNCFYLWVFGAALENRLGWARLLGCFFGASLLSDLVEVALVIWVVGYGAGDMPLPSMGASGAVSGIMGLAGYRFLKNKLTLGDGVLFSGALPLLRFGVPVPIFIGWSLFWDGYGLFASTSRVNHLAHLLGFAAGFWIARRFGIAKDGRDDVVWDQARTDMELGWWKAAVPKLREVLGRRPQDLEPRAELLHCLGKLSHPNPAREDAWRDEARALLDESLCLALSRGDKAWALAQIKSAAPAILPEQLGAKCRLMLKAAGLA